MKTIDTQIAERLKRLLLMLSSNHDGEVIAAAKAVDRTLKAADHDWHDLVENLTSPSPAPYARRRSEPPRRDSSDEIKTWRAMHAFCLQHQDRLRPREAIFVAGLKDWRGNPTIKQMKWLTDIYNRLKATEN
ncbi:MAG: hypothetical protein ACLP19_17095 [Xanthobacteraceae bacterium]